MIATRPPLIKASLQTVIQSVLWWIEDAVNGLSLVDWVLLGLAFAIFSYVIAALRAQSQLGPVEVTELESDDEKSEAKSLTAALRNHLADSGLMPSSEVPGGAPEADILAAVEASPIPQANWIASLMQAIPKPRPASYALKGTLRTLRKDTGGCGVTYLLQDTVHGTHVQAHTSWKATYDEAVRDVASRVYIAITHAAPHIYPRWSWWSSQEAFEHYRAGIGFLLDSRGKVNRGAEYDQALACHRLAAQAEPRNPLPRLQIANIAEKQAGAATGSEKAGSRLHALQHYLRIGGDVPSLVEARYRASVLLGSIATDVGAFDGNQLDALRETLPAEQTWPADGDITPEEIAQALQSTSDHESKAALRQLGRLSSILRLRFPDGFEPQGHERKGLRTTIKIARRCTRVRRMPVPVTPGQRRRVWIQQWGWNLRVVVALLDISGHASWQVHYNAACLYALMYAKTPDRNRWRRNAFKRLNAVVEDPLSELREDWLATGDRDLTSIRDGSPEWKAIARRYSQDPRAGRVGPRPQTAAAQADAAN